MAHGTQTFQSNCVTKTWHTSRRRFRAIVSCKPDTRRTDDLGQVGRKPGTRAQTF